MFSFPSVLQVERLLKIIFAYGFWCAKGSIGEIDACMSCASWENQLLLYIEFEF